MAFDQISLTRWFGQCVRHNCNSAQRTRRAFRTAATVSVLALVTVSCSETPRTATNFCRQLAKELPGITQPSATQAEVSSMLDRYKRLGKVAPLAIEADWKSLTELLTLASRMNATDSESVQAVVDMSYSTKKAADAAAKWILETCAVDISTGLNVGPSG